MVFQVPAKRKGFSTKEKVIIPLTIILFVLFYVFVLYNPQNRVASPSPSSFKFQPWMSFIPENTEGFRFSNLTQQVKFPNVFSNSVLLSIKEPQINISLTDVTYELDIINETQNNIITTVIALNKTYLNYVEKIIKDSNPTSVVYGKITLYKLKTAQLSLQGETWVPFFGDAWISFFGDALILSESGAYAQEGIKAVYNAASSSFFVNDSFKVGYLIASISENQLSFSFFQSGNNTLNVLWEMHSAFNTTEITVRNAFYFASSKDLDSKYQEFVNGILQKSKKTWVSDNFLVGEFNYPLSEIRAVLMGL